MVKIVLVSQRLLENSSYPETRQALAMDWAGFFDELGDIVPVPIMYNQDIPSYFTALNPAGLLLTGGNDLAVTASSSSAMSPGKQEIELGKSWMHPPHKTTNETLSLMRDDFEGALLQEAIQRGIPVLGVCRGLQVLASTAGAKLVKTSGHVATEHELSSPPSLDAIPGIWKEWMNSNSNNKVNSYHGFAVVDLPASSGLKPVFTDENGAVEALYGTLGASKILGMMWHPERAWLGSSRQADVNLFRSFFGADDSAESRSRASSTSGAQAPPPALTFGTKAENLQNLSGVLKSARVAPVLMFTLTQWQDAVQKPQLIERAMKLGRPEDKLIVRSSSTAEDTNQESNAGKFTSLDGISPDAEAIEKAVEEVFASYGTPGPIDQVLVQTSLTPVQECGVLFTADLESHLPYMILSYDSTGSTDGVTSGSIIPATIRRLRWDDPCMPTPVNAWEKDLYAMAAELEVLYGTSLLDIEFAVTKGGELYCLQVRPIVTRRQLGNMSLKEESVILRRNHEKIYKKLLNHLGKGHVELPGSNSILGVMTDWNPAEMIGVRPRPLAKSLYMELITDSVAMKSREEIGFRRVSAPLMVSLLGYTYIDCRVSFASFVPASVPFDTADKLITHYLDELRANPEWHDKVEFEILFTCNYPGMRAKLDASLGDAFSSEERQCIWEGLRDLTNHIMDPKNGVLKTEQGHIEELDRRCRALDPSLHVLQRIFYLIKDIKQFGTLPFSKFARFGFMAKQTLMQLVAAGALTKEDVDSFMLSIHTVGGELVGDATKMRKGELPKEDFLKKYGHLRPGTYDINSKRYDEAFGAYFPETVSFPEPSGPAPQFSLSVEKRTKIRSILDDNGITVSVDDLFEFLKVATEWREYAKFVFTRSLSEVLVLMETLGKPYGLSRDEMSYVPIAAIMELYSTLEADGLGQLLHETVEKNMSRYRSVSSLQLPHLITRPEDTLYFSKVQDDPNFVSNKVVSGEVVVADEELANKDLTGKIVCIPNADPGWDWVFARNILGLITCFGGANSHMTIRAAELNLPSVIGVGPEFYADWSSASALELDCSGKVVRVLSRLSEFNRS